MYNVETYKKLAKHFAESLDVTLVFEKDVCPSTDGHEIRLPLYVEENALYPLLGALLHETAHIRFSEPLQHLCKTEDLTTVERDVVNVLEDIRVDHKTLETYPKAGEFSRRMILHATASKEDKFKAEPQPVQILKSLILIADNSLDVAQNLYSVETIARAQSLARYIDEARACETTSSVVPLARALIAELYDKITSEEQKKQNQQSKADRREQKLSEANQLRDSARELQQKANGLRYQINKEKKNHDMNQTRARHLESQAKYETEPDEKVRLQKKADRATARADEHEKSSRLHTLEYNQLAEELDKKQAESSLLVKDAYAGDAVDGLQVAGWSRNVSNDLLGFSSLGDVSEKNIPIEPVDNFKNQLRAVIVKHRSDKIENDSGNTLNERRLVEIIADDNIDEAFISNEIKEHQTKVSLIVDVSGSMGRMTDLEAGIDSALAVAVKSTLYIVNTLKELADEGLDVDINVYAFGSRVTRVISSHSEVNSLVSRLEHVVPSLMAGTNLVDAINTVNDEAKETGSDNTAIVISDASVCREELKSLVNYTSSDSTRFAFVRIGVEKDRDNEYVEAVFGHKSLPLTPQALQNLGDILIDSL